MSALLFVLALKKEPAQKHNVEIGTAFWLTLSWFVLVFFFFVLVLYADWDSVENVRRRQQETHQAKVAAAERERQQVCARLSCELALVELDKLTWQRNAATRMPLCFQGMLGGN